MATHETIQLQPIKEWRKVSWVVIKKTTTWVFVDCDGWLFTWVILLKEVRDLERNKVDLSVWSEIEAEIINPDIRHDQGYYIISISKLLQVDVRNNLIAKAESGDMMNVIPTEANLWGLLVDMHGIKWFIPLSQLAPIHYPRVEDGDQEVIFDKLLDLIWQEFSVKIISIDEDEKRIILSEREALREETEKIMAEIDVWSTYDWVVSGISSYGLFVTLGWSVEWLVHISEITYGHVNNIERLWYIGEKKQVKVIWLENGKISLSCKQLKRDPRQAISDEFKIWDTIEGEVVRFVPYGVFVRMYDDINGLIHLSELSDKGIANPAEAVKLWQIIKAKVILLDIKRRKIWLSMRALYESEEEGIARERRKQQQQRRYQQRPTNENTNDTPSQETQDSPATDRKSVV